MFKRLKESINQIKHSYRQNKLFRFYENQQYEKMVDMLKTQQEYNKMNVGQFSFVFFLINEGKNQAVKLLLKKAKYVNEILNKDNNPMSINPISYALLQGKKDIVETFIESGGNLNSKNTQLQNALHLAAIYKRKQAFNQAITQYKVDYNLSDQYGNTPFHYAARAGVVEMVATLVLSKAKKTANNNYQYPIHMAIESGNMQCVELLRNDLKAAYPKYHPLHSASRSESQYMFNMIVDQFPLMINIQDYQGLTPLHHLALVGNEAMLKKLLSFKGIDVNKQDKHGNTALHLSLLEDRVEISKILIEKKANMDIENFESLTPVDYGLSSHNSSIKSLIMDNMQKSKRLQETGSFKF